MGAGLRQFLPGGERPGLRREPRAARKTAISGALSDMASIYHSATEYADKTEGKRASDPPGQAAWVQRGLRQSCVGANSPPDCPLTPPHLPGDSQAGPPTPARQPRSG